MEEKKFNYGDYERAGSEYRENNNHPFTILEGLLNIPSAIINSLLNKK